jgi:hypothetical protein
MNQIFRFYETYGVEEYYVYDLTRHVLEGWQRSRGKLVPIRRINGYVSPRLGIRFDPSGDELVVYNPDGTPFLDSIQLSERFESEREHAEQAEQRADQEKQRADQEKQHADQEKQRADQEKQHADQEKQRADQEKQHADMEANNRKELIAKLNAMGIDTDKL